MGTHTALLECRSVGREFVDERDFLPVTRASGPRPTADQDKRTRTLARSYLLNPARRQLIGGHVLLASAGRGVVLGERGGEEDDAMAVHAGIGQEVAHRWTWRRCQEACSDFALSCGHYPIYDLTAPGN